MKKVYGREETDYFIVPCLNFLSRKTFYLGNCNACQETGLAIGVDTVSCHNIGSHII